MAEAARRPTHCTRWSRSALTARCGELCRHAATRCQFAVCVHNTQATPPRLRAFANFHTHLPSIEHPPFLGLQVGDANDPMKPLVRGPRTTSRCISDIPEAGQLFISVDLGASED